MTPSSAIFDRPLTYTPDSVKYLIPLTTFWRQGVNECSLPPITTQETQEYTELPENFQFALTTQKPSQTLLAKVTVPAGETKTQIIDLQSKELEGDGTCKTDLHFVAQDASTLNLYLVQHFTETVDHRSELLIELADDAKANVVIVDFGAKTHALNVKAKLANRAKLDLGAVYFATGEQKYDYNYHIIQAGEVSEANIDLHGALQDKAQKIMRYTLDFLKGSHGAVGDESEVVTLLSDGVKNASVPYLLSGEDDVEGSHAASIGQLDLDSLFYLMTRGLSLEDAKQIMIRAQFSAILDRLPQGDLYDLLMQELESKMDEVL